MSNDVDTPGRFSSSYLVPMTQAAVLALFFGFHILPLFLVAAGVGISLALGLLPLPSHAPPFTKVTAYLVLPAAVLFAGWAHEALAWRSWAASLPMLALVGLAFYAWHSYRCVERSKALNDDTGPSRKE